MSAPLAYDGSYFKSISGILKICCMTCCFIGFLCIICSSVALHNFRGCFYLIVVLLGFLFTSIILLARLYQLFERKFQNFDAVKWEFYLNATLAVACFISSVMAITLDVTSYTVAAFFGMLAFSFYAIDGYFCYRLNRKCDVQTQTEVI